jgi:hypothetical protein
VSPLGAALPVAEDVNFRALKAHCRALLEATAGFKEQFPESTRSTLKTLIEGEAKEPSAAAEKVQRLLDEHCLIGVTINPESRVKAERGPAPAALPQGREVAVLVKVSNQAGVTQGLAVTGPQLRAAGSGGEGRWLEAKVLTRAPLRKTLSGEKVEYVVLLLKAHEAGKREATLQFDVGQGTQDLGFRAEVPVLFTVRPAGK